MSDVKLQIAADVREILESRGIRDEDVAKVISNAEETGEKLYREDRFLSKLVIEEATYYVEYSVADGETYTVHTAYFHRAKLEEE
jgi:hypothetical protein